MPTELARLDRLLEQGLAATADHWPAIRKAYGWVHAAAHLLHTAEPLSVEERRRRYRDLLATMSRERSSLGELAPAVGHFLKVTKSYWRGLFHCYEIPGLPATNNELEQTFGTARYHERRASGRKSAGPGMIVRGAVRVVAAVIGKLLHLEPGDLCPHDLGAWATLREQLVQRAKARAAQRRFRQDPEAYLQHAESLLLGASLPA